ncbi:MAG TPA: ferredoxin--NADP reductase [Candidatus Acidoferrales bacterium]|nr:ferredoxin--NADP reductase [Candidatus Acidoferrales bacterium]
MTEPAYYSLRVREVIDEGADAKSIVFEIPPEHAEAFRYRPGQFLTLRVAYEGRHLLRCYSLASCPLVEEPPRVTIKRVAQGRASNWICDRIKAGDTIEVKPPAGHFTPRSLDEDFLLFAGGSGITPIFSIVRSALIAGRGSLCLIYANRDEQSVIFRDQLKLLANDHPNRLQVIHWLDSVQGLPSVAQLAKLARSWSSADCYVCGPEAFMDCALQAIRGLGVAPARIHVERFVSLPDEEDAAPVVEPGANDQIHLEVELDGVHHELTCSRGEPILDAMLRVGLKAPHSCRSGACGSCMCTLEAGEVHLRHNQVLDSNDLKQGWILACQSIADSASVRVRFPD